MKIEDKASPYIVMGKIGSTYGVQGWLKISAYTENLQDILTYPTWRLIDPSQTEATDITKVITVEIEEGRVYGKGLIAKLKHYNAPEIAKTLTGKLIVIGRDELPRLGPDEFYWSDLVGLTVINKDGRHLGIVKYLLATGSNDVLVIKGQQEIAIPYLLNQVILKIDLEKREIWVDWELI